MYYKILCLAHGPSRLLWDPPSGFDYVGGWPLGEHPGESKCRAQGLRGLSEALLCSSVCSDYNRIVYSESAFTGISASGTTSLMMALLTMPALA